jgi:hypothetical protein
VNRSLAKKIAHDTHARDRAQSRKEKRPKSTAKRTIGKRRRAVKRGKRPLDIWPETVYRAFGTKSAVVAIPEKFSFISDPDETLDTLVQLRRVLELESLERVRLDYSRCQSLDLCASVVQDVLALTGRRQAKFRGRSISVDGTFSASSEINLMLVSSGILAHLRHPISKSVPSAVKERLKFSRLRVGAPSPPNVTSETELASTALANFFDDCLRSEHHQLKPFWKSNLIQLITEVLDNAEEHGSGDRRWYTIGYYNRNEDPVEGGDCHIVLFNFGDSIYESLNRDDTSSSLKMQIGTLAHEHRSKGFFAILGKYIDVYWPIWQEESLWTLYALQEGVSRFTNQSSGIDRGNGTVKMIEFFSELASGRPQMALVSGKTHILFDGKYSIAPIEVDGEIRKVIAFNKDNNLRERPDPDYVRSLRNHFPGTLISLNFQLKQADLALIKEKLDAEEQSDRSG